MRELPRAGELIARKYRIERELGAGGMGVVYEAVNIDTDRKVALKWLNPQLSTSEEANERFKREAKVMGRIDHPNVVAAFDCGESDGQLYLVMELLRGKSLREHLPKGPMPVEEACRIMLPVIRGVAAAHAAGVLHRDLKPENIFLCDSPDGLESVPKVLDFGIAKLHSDLEETALSAASALLGTYQYMAPEQLRKQRDLDERVDVYALGVVLYRMLVGTLPYHADNPVDLALQILQTEAPFASTVVPAVPVALGEVVARAIEPNRDKRFQNMHELAVALEPFAGGLRYRGAGTGPQQQQPSQPIYQNRKAAERPVSAQATPFVATFQNQRRKRAWGWSIGGVSGAVALAAAGWFGWVHPSAPDTAPDELSKSSPAADSATADKQPQPRQQLPLAAQIEDASVDAEQGAEWESARPSSAPVELAADAAVAQPTAEPSAPLERHHGRRKTVRQGAAGKDSVEAESPSRTRVGKLSEGEF